MDEVPLRGQVADVKHGFFAARFDRRELGCERREREVGALSGPDQVEGTDHDGAQGKAQPFGCGLRHGVWRARFEAAGLAHRQFRFRHRTIDLGARGDDQAARFGQGAGHGDDMLGALHVDPVVVVDSPPGGLYVGQARQVDDRIRRRIPEHAVDRVAVADVEGDVLGGDAGVVVAVAGDDHSRGMAGDDGGPPCDQSRHQAAADEPLGAGDQDALHASALPCPSRSK